MQYTPQILYESLLDVSLLFPIFLLQQIFRVSDFSKSVR